MKTRGGCNYTLDCEGWSMTSIQFYINSSLIPKKVSFMVEKKHTFENSIHAKMLIKNYKQKCCKVILAMELQMSFS